MSAGSREGSWAAEWRSIGGCAGGRSSANDDLEDETFLTRESEFAESVDLAGCLDIELGTSKETDFLGLDTAADFSKSGLGFDSVLVCPFPSSSIFARRRNRWSSCGSIDAINSSLSRWIWESDMDARCWEFSLAIDDLSSSIVV